MDISSSGVVVFSEASMLWLSLPTTAAGFSSFVVSEVSVVNKMSFRLPFPSSPPGSGFWRCGG
eukprot:scaffold23991_cov99-Amphora_coffeaeformis.AAC.1